MNGLNGGEAIGNGERFGFGDFADGLRGRFEKISLDLGGLPLSSAGDSEGGSARSASWLSSI
jgi:hypothetical protein